MNVLNRSLYYLALFAIILCGRSAFGITLEVLPSTADIQVNDSISFDINIAGLGNGATPSLSTYDVDVSFDSSMLAYQGVIFGDQLDLLGFGSVQFATNSGTSIDVYEVSFDDPIDLTVLQLPEFTLFTLDFNAIAEGTSGISLSVQGLGDEFAAPLIASSITNASVSIQPTTVPEPSTLLLFAVGLGGLGFGRRILS